MNLFNVGEDSFHVMCEGAAHLIDIEWAVVKTCKFDHCRTHRKRQADRLKEDEQHAPITKVAQQ